MKFNIIENAEPDYNLQEIIKDYKNLNLTVEEIREKHNISRGTWQTIIKHMKKEDVPLRGYKRKKASIKGKHYCFNRLSKRYRVQRVINGEYYHFGVYATEKEAQERVEELHRNRWDGLLKE